MEGQIVKMGETRQYELFAVNDALDCEWRGPERCFQVLNYLDKPDGVKITRGRRLESFGYFDVEANDFACAITLPRPNQSVSLTLPVRVIGLNPRWSAGLFQIKGHSSGYYSDGMNGYTSLGFDFEGRVYGALFPDMSDRTEVIIGHPIVCDNNDLFIEVMPLVDKAGKYTWHIAVNNPTDQSISARFRQAMKRPGPKFPDQQHVIPAGGDMILHSQ